MTEYHINVFFSEDDDCWVADVPDLKYCSALGSTPEKAVREVQRAKTAWLKVAKASGKSVPMPKYRPVIYQLAQ